MTILEPPEVTDRRLKLELRLAKLNETKACQEDFIQYVKKVWPEFINGSHHTMIAKKFEAIANGTNKRLIINMPPDIRSQSLQVTCFRPGLLAVIQRPRSFKPPIRQN